MTSGYMNCPKCGEGFPYANYEYIKTGLFLDKVWVNLPEPWECPKCRSLIVTDKEKGYGLVIE